MRSLTHCCVEEEPVERRRLFEFEHKRRASCSESCRISYTIRSHTSSVGYRLDVRGSSRFPIHSSPSVACQLIIHVWHFIPHHKPFCCSCDAHRFTFAKRPAAQHQLCFYSKRMILSLPFFPDHLWTCTTSHHLTYISSFMHPLNEEQSGQQSFIFYHYNQQEKRTDRLIGWW